MSRAATRAMKWAFVGAMATAAPAAAETVVIVPYAQQNKDLPHPAHSGAPITLKAIVRGLTCDQGYDVTWDVNLDRQYTAADGTVRYGRTQNTLWDIGRTWTVPVVQFDQPQNVGVQVRNVCNNQIYSGSFPLYIYAFQPSNDPRQWTRDQLDIMGSMAVQETLWYLHRQTWFYNNDRGANASTIKGRFGQSYVSMDGTGIWAMTINGHLPAFPPGTIDRRDQNNVAQPLPNGWEVANDRRWNDDPYAETVLRWSNDLTHQAQNYRAVPADDEASTCGYNAQRQAIACNRTASPADGRGWTLAAEGEHSYSQGMQLGGYATLLPALGGIPVQEGQAKGRKYEWLVQQVVDYLGGIQIDGGTGVGGWYYHWLDGNYHCGYNDGSTTQWALVGLESAEVTGRPFGIVVNNRHKYRVAESLVRMIGGDGSAGYRCGYTSNFQLTGGAILGARWLGVHAMPSDNVVPFPNDSGYTRAQLRSVFDRYLEFTRANWNSNSLAAHGGGWTTRLWRGGDPYCGNLNRVYNTDDNAAIRCGNTYAAYSHQKGYRTASPEQTIAGHDWYREFLIYYIRALNRGVDAGNGVGGQYGIHGRLVDNFCNGADGHSVTCAYGAPFMSSSAAGLILTPTIFNPKPVAVARVNGPNSVTATVVEGCVGGNNGTVNLLHDQSFHPNPSASILLYQWDVDASNGLWWENNGQPDFQSNDRAAAFTYRYLRAGVYTATLRVVDNGLNDAQQTKTATVTVTVNAAANVAPTAASGGPYVVEVGGALQLAGTATDGNQACGQQITVAWDLNNANTWNAAAATNGVIAWAALQNLPRAPQTIPLRLRVRDAANSEAISATTITIYPTDPVANGSAVPNPAACNQDITFNGGNSFHPNPNRSIATYEWDVNGDGTYDGGGRNPTFVYRYPAFGTYTVTLRVTDDLGRRNTTQFQVQVNQGNLAPVARTSRANYEVLEGDNLTLDGAGSSDANVACGDSIVAYEWDINGDGDFNDAGVDTTGVRPVIAWGVLNTLRKWADPVTGLPNNTITLRVRDEFGAEARINATITIFQAAPIPVVVQSPNPAPINLVTGFSNPTLNGQESRSPIPNVNIVSWDWDLNDDGVFEVQGRASVEFVKVFNPVPQPNNIPATFVRLQVTDSQGRRANVRYQVVYRVPPTPPTADADPTSPPERNYHILVGQGVALDPRQSFDPDARDFGDYIRTYRWDVNANVNGNADWNVTVNDPNGQQQNVVSNLTWAQLNNFGVNGPGQSTLLLEVEDTTNLRNRDTATLNVYPVNPIAVATANPNPAACGDTITFDGRASDHAHPDIRVVSWAWDLDGDGQYDDGAGQTVTQAFNRFTFNQPIRVGLQVTDSSGNVGTTSLDVSVEAGNHAPVATPGGPYTIVRGDALNLDGRGSLDPDAACGDSIVDYAWDIGNNGSYEVSGANAAQTARTWQQLNDAGVNNVGAYTIALRVRDRFGVQSVSTVQLNVINGPTAAAVAIPGAVACNGEVLFDGSGSRTDAPANDPAFALAAWEWDFDGDGQYETSGATVRRAVAGLGNSVTVRFRVTDASGHRSETQVVVQLNVQNVAPNANAGGPYVTGPVPGGYAPVTLDGRASTDPNMPCDAIGRYLWDADDDGVFGTNDNALFDQAGVRDYEGATVAGFRSPRWNINNVYRVGLQVCDSKNPALCSGTAFANVRVLAEAPPTGEILSPRSSDADFCAGANPFNVSFRVAHPTGAQVTVRARVGGQEVAGPIVVNTNANGTPVDGTIQINPANIAEGLRSLELVFRSGVAAEQVVNAGGNILFDRTGPTVTFGARPAANACYPLNQVPAPEYQVSDMLDPNPEVDQATSEDGCGRTLTVSATDRCGNVGSAARTYLIAEQPEVAINGAAEGALVSSARMTWAVEGPAGCALNIQAFLSRNGAARAAYVANTEIRDPGAYVLTLEMTNCALVQRQIIRTFTVNGPPTADAITAGHVNADPMVPGGYIVAEGGGLQLDASESRPPEAGDSVTGYRWDWRNDNTWDFPGGAAYANAATAAYPTNDNGIFMNKLEVRDSLNATAQVVFQVRVNDVNPTARPGGPYTVAQGVELILDGAATTAGHPVADPLQTFTWNFGDGSAPESGPPATHAQRPHTYAENGVYTVTLRVDDEDSFHVAQTTVTVRDVDPVVDSLDLPDPAFEIAGMQFTINANGGSAADPITRAEWDFTGDGVPEIAGPWPAYRTVVYEFETDGNYTVAVKLFDKDSSMSYGEALPVRQITMDELLTVAQQRIDLVRAANQAQPLVIRDVSASDTEVEHGHWGETYDRRGVTMQAYAALMEQIASALSRGPAQNEFRNLLWAMSRTALREINAMHDRVAANPRDAIAVDSIEVAERSIAAAAGLYNDPDFRQWVSTSDDPLLASDLIGAVFNAYFYLADAEDPFNRFDLFPMPDIDDVRTRVAAANEVNQNLLTALNELLADLNDYVSAGGANDPAPGQADVQAAIDVLENDIMPLMELELNVLCADPTCINDQQALHNELFLMDLINSLYSASAEGAYVRNWQHSLMLAVKFRVELSILRVEYACGAFQAVSQNARAQQAIGLRHVENRDFDRALNYYLSNETHCLIIRTYNTCLSPLDPANAPPEPFPPGICPNDAP
ncbi:PKD domain-containing protein [Myxococcota bacterium]|nr:PKD domain-containing protein [Myxococcota bacterium]